MAGQWVEIENRDEDTKAIEIAVEGEIPADWRESADLARQAKFTRGIVTLTLGSSLDVGHADPRVPLPRFWVPGDLWNLAKKSPVVKGWLDTRKITEAGRRLA